MEEIELLRYPIGRFIPPADYQTDQIRANMESIRELPGLLETAVLNLDRHQIDTPYRPEGWTIQQVVHHLADSHMNAYIRFKLALTEDGPVIKPYKENLWAELYDSFNTPVNISLTLLHSLHIRWVNLMGSLDHQDWEKTVFHPEHQKFQSLYLLAGLYAWHGRHHLAHITRLRERMGWD